MKKERKTVTLARFQQNTGQIDWLPKNPRQWTQTDIDRTVKSIEEDTDFLEDRPLLAVEKGDKLVVFAGNLRLTAVRKTDQKAVPVVVYSPESDEDKETIQRRALKDNGSFGSWDYDTLANEWDGPFEDWGITVPDWEVRSDTADEMSADEVERKKREFEERMKAGEISEEDEEYQEFVEKFQLKKTTDDCYTPPVVYEAISKWVAETYHVNPDSFVRPFYPGGDYKKESYPNGTVVVDNPPFSILAEIVRFYQEQRIKFFLFAPHLTLFSTSTSPCALPCNVGITYENGATVSTSFLTNLEDPSLRIRSCPSLYKAVKEANDVNLRGMSVELPKYRYDKHIITSHFVGSLSRLGIEFSVPVAESERISQLESQKASGKGIYGYGYIVSEQVFAEREKAEREEREKVQIWKLSPKEMEIIRRLSRYGSEHSEP